MRLLSRVVATSGTCRSRARRPHSILQWHVILEGRSMDSRSRSCFNLLMYTCLYAAWHVHIFYHRSLGFSIWHARKQSSMRVNRQGIRWRSTSCAETRAPHERPGRSLMLEQSAGPKGRSACPAIRAYRFFPWSAVNHASWSWENKMKQEPSMRLAECVA